MDHGYCWKIVKVLDYDEVCILYPTATANEPRTPNDR